VSQERTDACLDGIDEIRRIVTRGGPVYRLAVAVLDLARFAMGKDARNVPFLIIGTILFAAVVWATGEYTVKAFGAEFTSHSQAAQDASK
jgi:hypothetical protein